jgi:peroxin-1
MRCRAQVRLPAPGSSGRAKILANSFSQRGFSFPREQLELLAGKADGYDASDLQVLLERAVHAALARQLASGQCASGQGQVEVSPEDMHAAFEGFVPAAFWGVQKSAGGALLHRQ